MEAHHFFTRVSHFTSVQLPQGLKEKRSTLIIHAVTKGLDPNVSMKDSGMDWIEKIPVHWSIEKLGNHCKTIVNISDIAVQTQNK